MAAKLVLGDSDPELCMIPVSSVTVCKPANIHTYEVKSNAVG